MPLFKSGAKIQLFYEVPNTKQKINLFFQKNVVPLHRVNRFWRKNN